MWQPPYKQMGRKSVIFHLPSHGLECTCVDCFQNSLLGCNPTLGALWESNRVESGSLSPVHRATRPALNLSTSAIQPKETSRPFFLSHFIWESVSSTKPHARTSCQKEVHSSVICRSHADLNSRKKNPLGRSGGLLQKRQTLKPQSRGLEEILSDSSNS